MKNECKEKMNQVMDHFREELKHIRTGRANPAILDNVTVEVYGTEMRLKDIAQVTVPEPRQLLVTPFDANNTQSIGKGIERANLGVQPTVDANVVRILIPPMDEALRKEMAKLVSKKKEECKVAIRNVRRDMNEKARKDSKDGVITEDVLKRVEKEVQEQTDHFCKEADQLAHAKEEEIMTI